VGVTGVVEAVGVVFLGR